jgi:type II restriction enzyme
MRLDMPGELARQYNSRTQQARVVTEAWGEANLYCANCTSGRLQRLPTNTPALDFRCPQCASLFQLKSQRHAFTTRINDAAYDKMCEAVLQGRTPNLLALHYDHAHWSVRNLVLVPRFAFSLSCIEKRKPLSELADRAGWVGCNILLVGIPLDARIPLVADGQQNNPAWVRQQYNRLRPLEKLRHDARGWTLDVLNVVRGLGKPEFTLVEVYAHEPELAWLHPGNRFIRPKIRQQLQGLRDLGLVEFLGRGRYRARG